MPFLKTDGNECKDDPTISDSNGLYRRLHGDQIVFDRNSQSWRPSSSAFSDHKNGSPMSVSIDHPRYGIAHVMRKHRGFGLSLISAGLVRSLRQEVDRDPLENDPAHGCVCGEKPKSVRRKMAQGAELLINPKVNDPLS